MLKIFLFILLIAGLFSCVSPPKFYTKYDEFKGGYTFSLVDNRLETKVGPAVYFNVEALKINNKFNLRVQAKLYEYSKGISGKINKNSDLSVIVDGQLIKLKPIKDSYDHFITYIDDYGNASHYQIMEYDFTKQQLIKISQGQSVKMKIFFSNHSNNGVVEIFMPKNLKVLKEFLAKVG